MNNKVTVTGMEVKTKVSNNLLIAADELSSTEKKADSEFKTELTQVVKGVLEPVPTANGNTFFYTIDAKANGGKNQSVDSSAFIQYNAGDDAVDTTSYADLFSETYGISKETAKTLTGTTTIEKAVPYVDYVFQLKATNTSESVQGIMVEQLNLKYNGSLPDSYAHRVAFFIADITTSAVSSSAVGSSSTFCMGSSANFDETGSSATLRGGKVVSATNAFSNASYVNAKQSLVEVPAGQVRYYKVVVRLWLEGQDATCNNETFMDLTQGWELGVKLALVDLTTVSSSAVININQVDSSGNLINP